MLLKTIALAAAFATTATLSLAQGNPSGPGAVTGDPAASSANPSCGGTEPDWRKHVEGEAAAVSPRREAKMTIPIMVLLQQRTA